MESSCPPWTETEQTRTKHCSHTRAEHRKQHYWNTWQTTTHQHINTNAHSQWWTPSDSSNPNLLSTTYTSTTLTKTTQSRIDLILISNNITPITHSTYIIEQNIDTNLQHEIVGISINATLFPDHISPPIIKHKPKPLFNKATEANITTYNTQLSDLKTPPIVDTQNETTLQHHQSNAALLINNLNLTLHKAASSSIPHTKPPTKNPTHSMQVAKLANTILLLNKTLRHKTYDQEAIQQSIRRKLAYASNHHHQTLTTINTDWQQIFRNSQSQAPTQIPPTPHDFDTTPEHPPYKRDWWTARNPKRTIQQSISHNT